MSEQVTIGPPADLDELKSFMPVHGRTYMMSAEEGEAWAERSTVENFRIVRRGDKIIGGLNLRPMGQWFGGRSVPMTGISAVGVEPAERASGAGSQAMREVLVELHQQGTALSSLYPATQLVYRRCGWELAGNHILYRIDTDHIDTRDRNLEIELTEDRDTVLKLYDETARRTSGLLDRNENMWKRTFEPWKSEAQIYLVNGSAGAEGYIVYSRERGEAVRAHMNADVVALTPAAARRILTFVADHRSFIETFNWAGSPGDIFTFVLSEPRRKVQLSWPWMLRIVELRAALSERGYPRGLEAELHLRVADDMLPANDGSFVLSVSGGKAEVQPGGNGTLAIDVRGLAALYTGYMSAHELLATGYIEGEEDDLLTADAIFAGPAPWLADFF